MPRTTEEVIHEALGAPGSTGIWPTAATILAALAEAEMPVCAPGEIPCADGEANRAGEKVRVVQCEPWVGWNRPDHADFLTDNIDDCFSVSADNRWHGPFAVYRLVPVPPDRADGADAPQRTDR